MIQICFFVNPPYEWQSQNFINSYLIRLFVFLFRDGELLGNNHNNHPCNHERNGKYLARIQSSELDKLVTLRFFQEFYKEPDGPQDNKEQAEKPSLLVFLIGFSV